MAEQTVTCPICGSQIMDYGRNWACEAANCPQKFKVYKEMSGYQLTVADLVNICGGAITDEHEFTSKAKGTQFKARLAWNSQERKVEFKFENSREAVKGVHCPEHNKELRASEKRYYCPTKLSEGVWCPVGAWRSYGSHQLTGEELGKLLLGLEVGPWNMKKKDGSGTYLVMAQYDFDQNVVTLTYVTEPGGNEAQPNTVPTVAATKASPTGSAVTVSAPTASTATGSVATESQAVPKWVEILPEKAAQVTKLLGLDDVDSDLILEAAIASVTGARGKSAKDITTSEVANAVRTELNELAIGRLEPQAHFGDDGSECYVLVSAS